MKKEPHHLAFVCLSDTGRVRALNEDNVAIDADYGVAVVADGIGGHRAGEVASRMAVDIVVERLRDKIQHFRAGARQPTPLQFAEQIIVEANRAIHAAAREQAGCAGMGTTLAVALFIGQRVALLHVGDSRIYRLRDGRLQLLTRDDSLLSDQVEHGLIAAEDSRGSHNRHLVTQALGAAARVAVHASEEKVLRGDVYLLCSDGLSDLVEEADIELIVDSLKTNLPLTANHLIQLANDNGGYDNISVALVRVLDAEPVVNCKSWFSRLFGWLKPSTPEK
ncbi:MAG: protein phosphatase 2C domain-containing protein [Azonexus sp.]|nr:protein phosphatase 2C domain-containing protein [Azonexus sp.]